MAVGGRVVVADGDRAVLEMLQIRLEVVGFSVCPARTAASALDQLAGPRPAALIIDAGLNNAGGARVLQAIQQTHGAFCCPTLVIGRNLTPDDLALAFELGANAAVAKPFGGAEILERLGWAMRQPNELAPLHVLEAQGLDQQALQTRYPLEAAEHRRILFARGSGLCPTWKSFRQFLADVGPSPGPDYLATRLAAGDLTYAPGKVAWMHRDRQPSLSECWALIPSGGRDADGRFATVRGREVGYRALSVQIGVPIDAIAVALRGRTSADEMLQQACVADALTQDEAPWMPDDRREAFMMGFRMWHLQVQPRFAAAATPAFLYVFSALPGLLKSRDELEAAELWNPPTEAGKQARSLHPQWRRFREASWRVDAARQQLVIYRQYCLMTELDALWSRVRSAEERFRKPSLAPSKLAA